MNAPANIAAPDAVSEMLNLIMTLKELGRSPDAILKTMEIEGARLRFSGGAYMVRFRGVAGTSTAGGNGLVNAWIRAARRRLDRTGGAA